MPDPIKDDPKHVLVLNYTMACPLACDFCCYGCGPKRQEKMPLELALQLIREAASLKIFSSVAFTGGEPLLFADEIIILAEELKLHGMPFSVATAAHWATDAASTTSLVEELCMRGLTKVGISSDPSHEKFVKKENVLRAAQAFATRGINTFVVGSFHDDSVNMESYFPAVSQLPGVVTKSHNVCNVGKGLKLVSKHAAVQAIRTEDLRCYRPKYHDIVIFHDGNAYPCCSVFNRSAKELCLGNANTESLKTLFNRAEGSLLIRTLKSVGFKAAYEIAVARDPGLKDILPPLSGAIDACSHCRDVFGNRKTAERMQAAFIGHEVDYIIGVLRTVERIEGSNVRDKIIAEISQASSN